MNAGSDILPKGAIPATSAKEPSLAAIVLIFWCAFAVAVVAARIMTPALFEAQDPDSFLRMANVRDLVAGQGWFDLVQHRMDPPGGALLQWSRLIDAPLAALVIIGRHVGLGDDLALTFWPILLLLGLMAGAAGVASALGGKAAAIATLILVFFFLDPLFVYLPGDIDHHNAQVAVMIATVAFALRFRGGALFGFLAGAGSALTLAIGLEMLPHVAVLGTIIAVAYAWTGENRPAVAAYGLTIGILPAALYALTGSREASMACDSLSWTYAVPAAIAGLGLACVAHFAKGRGRGFRLTGLAIAAAASGAWFAGMTPECLAGPYGQLSPEVKRVFLDTVSEAQPIWSYAEREPVGAVGSLAPLLVALFIAAARFRRSGAIWLVPTVLLGLATALCVYQVRTLPFASALTIPILGVWLSELYARGESQGGGRVRRMLPAAVGFVLAVPYLYLLVAWGGEKAVAALTNGRIAPVVEAEPDPALVKGLSPAEQNCFDPTSGALLAEVPRGLVLAPLFYGSTVLNISAHDVVAGPYHRNGQAILDAVTAVHGSPDTAKAIIDRRHVDYVVVCATSQESALAAHKAPGGFLADLLAGKIPAWLEPVPAREATALRLWRVLR